jgi:nucleotide-binding universal stress UspA family protein
VTSGVTFDKVLIAIDGSARAERSLPWVNLLFPQAKKVLLRVVAPEPASEDYPAGRTAKKEPADQYVATLAKSMAGALGLVQEGSPGHAILKAASGVRVDVIAITTHGASNPQATTMGGTAEQILFGAHLPVLVVPSAEECFRPPGPLRRILVPVDGTVASETVVPIAWKLARKLGACVTLAHVLSQTERGPESETRFRKLALSLDPDPAKIKVVVKTGRLPDVLIDLAREGGADMIAMSPHGYGGLTRLIFGSMSSRMVRACPHPLLIVPGRSSRRSRRRSSPAAAAAHSRSPDPG